MATRSPLFCDTALARRIERAETRLIADARRATQARTGIDGFLIPVAGGMASFAEPDSPFNKVVGLGFDGVPSDDELDAIEKAFAAHGAPTQVELAHLAESAIGELLTDRGYRLESFENVLGLALDDAGNDPELITPPGIEVRLSTDDELDTWIAVVADAGTHPDTQGLPWHDEFPREAVENAERDFAAAGGTRYAAFRDGVLAGGADFRITDGIAQLAEPQPLRRIAATACSPRWSPPGSPMPGRRDAMSRSSSPSRVPGHSKTRSAAGSTCSTPAPRW